MTPATLQMTRSSFNTARRLGLPAGEWGWFQCPKPLDWVDMLRGPKISGWSSRPGLVRLFALSMSLSAAFIGAVVPFRHAETKTPKFASPQVCDGWTATVACELPEPACSLLADEPMARLFIGTAGNADVYVFPLESVYEVAKPFALGLGDVLRYGFAEVNTLALVDLDGDGDCELLAETSQVTPRGNPALFAWKLAPSPTLLATVKPEIASSWSHGLAGVRSPFGNRHSVVSSHCGYGEIVEYRLDSMTTYDGRKVAGLSWRKIADLPASGESIQTHNLDRNRQEICVAVGFGDSKAELRFYRPTNRWAATKGDAMFATFGQSWRLAEAIDEGKRFANVRFVTGNLDCQEFRDVIAFWTTDLTGGHCMAVRYSFDAKGRRKRAFLFEGPTDDYWPLENQLAIASLGGRGSAQIWFASVTGNLWRHSGKAKAPPLRILHAPDGLGPIAAIGQKCLMVASKNTLYKVAPSTDIPCE